ncbi:hypothetical protein BTO20_08820 [Mycobacterium dioxanotrophicus]|uniref:PE-PGRS family protein n=1 Tax=Mycobacterium dioxanotrophicus TaxID=482462 RepID=A0A1Y0C0F9_9MYCO|nr:hypothetical protein [Mycobacterium dioxanotrophicus]ART68670.1 hypothetical protein BTO20_08820 [Mycobacterium dioxanotrophicus]
MVGAGVIATTAINPPPDMHINDVRLAAAVENPADVFAPVFEFTEQVAAGLIAAEIADPAPVLTQFIANQIATATATGAIAINGVTTVAAIATGLPEGITAAAAAVAAGNPGQAPIEILNAVGIPAIQFLTESIPQAEWILQRPLAVAQALVPVALESTSLPIYLGISYVKPLVDTAVVAVRDVADAASTGDPANAINAIQHGVKDVAMRTIDLANATASVVDSTRQVIKTALQTQPLQAYAGGTNTVAAQSLSTDPSRSSLRSVFGAGNKARPGQVSASIADTDGPQASSSQPVKTERLRAKPLKSLVGKVKSGLAKVTAAAEQ